MTTSSGNGKISFLHRVLDNLADEHNGVDEDLSKDLMHQMEKLVAVMGGLRDEILESNENDRVAAEKLMQRVDSMRALQTGSENPEALGDALENIEELIRTITPNYSNDDIQQAKQESSEKDS